SLGEAQEQTENGSTNYTYSIIYENGTDKQVLGSIKINANNLSVIDFSISNPEVPENDTNDTVDDVSNNPEPGPYSEPEPMPDPEPSAPEPEPSTSTNEEKYSY
ncbi:MAG: hypothetical protein IKF79_03780, partial [Methanosphaera sp.]|nr:hypothetical protein [Methanosphaera sp.]